MIIWDAVCPQTEYRRAICLETTTSPLSKPETPQSVQCKANAHNVRSGENCTIGVETIHQSRESGFLSPTLILTSVPEESNAEAFPFSFNRGTGEDNMIL